MNTSQSSAQTSNRLLPELNERERQLRADYDWCLHDPGVQAAYAGQVVAVYQQKVWGAGQTHGEATQAALEQPGCPSREELARVYIEGTALPASGA